MSDQNKLDGYISELSEVCNFPRGVCQG